MKNRSIAAAIVIGAALAMPGTVCAQAFPSKPVAIVLSYAAGGPTDFLARTLGEKVSRAKGSA